MLELKIEIPENILNSLDGNKYSLLLFKEESGVKRLGLVFATDNPSALRSEFENWENEKTINREIYSAFKPLFLGSRITAASQSEFKTGEYLGVKMRYIQIPDQNTSLDYLIHNNILIITTSKGSAYQAIKILLLP